MFILYLIVLDESKFVRKFYNQNVTAWIFVLNALLAREVLTNVSITLN